MPLAVVATRGGGATPRIGASFCVNVAEVPVDGHALAALAGAGRELERAVSGKVVGVNIAMSH